MYSLMASISLRAEKGADKTTRLFVRYTSTYTLTDGMSPSLRGQQSRFAGFIKALEFDIAC